jgi:phosphatidylethanolamine/phosphatidyl-N-methylethanolamine N-methyltransferase
MRGADRRYWDKHAKNYDRSMALLGRPLPRMIQLVGGAVRGSHVLEVAAGTGLVTQRIASFAREVVATDYSGAMVAELEQRIRETGLENVRCQQADIYTLPFEPETFDAVVAANVLHLVPDLPGALVALRRVLRPDGHLIVPTFCHDQTTLSWIVSRLLAMTGFPGNRRFTGRSLVLALQSAGYRVLQTELIPGVIPIAYVEADLGPSQRRRRSRRSLFAYGSPKAPPSAR